MVMSSRFRIPTPRTPRKDKNWAYIHETRLISATNFDSIDLLAAYKTDLGITATRNLTCMRIIGRVQLTLETTAASAAYVKVRLGFLWQDPNTSTVNMEPWEPGVREPEWIQLGQIEGLESGIAPLVGRPATATPEENNQWNVDIRQMRKQPTPTHELRLVYWTNGLQETATLGLNIRLGMMLALP